MKILKHNQRKLHMSYIVCTDKLTESKILFCFKNLEENQLFKYFLVGYPGVFKTVSLPYFYDLIIRLSMQYSISNHMVFQFENTCHYFCCKPAFYFENFC